MTVDVPWACGPARRLQAAIAVSSLMVMTGGIVSTTAEAGPSAQQPCPLQTEVFLSNGYNSSKPYGYRLIIHNRSNDGIHSVADEPWVIQTFDRKTGRVTSELLLKRSCPADKENCTVGPRHGWKLGPAEEIGIDADFNPVRHAPYAIIVPGFVDWIWIFLCGLTETGDLKTQTRHLTTPGLSDQLIWVASCSDRSSDH